MIVYADTSALVKLFVVEENSQATQDMFRQAQVVWRPLTLSCGKQPDRSV